MKAILEFNMENWDDVKKHKRMIKADDLCYLISRFEEEALMKKEELTKEQIIEKYYEIKNRMYLELDEIWG